MCLETISFSYFYPFLSFYIIRATFNAKYARNGIHGGFFVRILKIYDENSKFEVILIDLLNENLKIYNRRPLVEYLEEKLKQSENQKNV